MGNEKFSDSRFFDIIIEKQTYRNFIYSVISFFLAVFYFVFLLSGLLISVLLSVVWVGVPFLIFVFDGVWFFVGLERKLLIWFFDVKAAVLIKDIQYYPNQMKTFLSYLRNRRTWRYFGYLLLKFPLGIISIIVPLIFLALTFLMVYFPIISVFGKINVFNFYYTESYIEVVFVFFCATVLWFGLLNVINWISRIMLFFTQKMLSK